jgi:hypothetical protein
LVQHDFGDSYWAARTGYYGITAMPTVCGDGMSDVWPLSGLEADFQAHTLVSSPLIITLTENSEGDFTAHIEAEAAVSDARFCMVAVHDDNVSAYGGATSHLPYHVVHMMTATAGDAFSLAAGASTDISHTFTVQPSWNYDKMGVACWVQAPGGTNTSPNPYGDVPTRNHVLQAAFIETGSTGVPDGEEVVTLMMMPPSPNPFRGASQLSFVAPRAGHATLIIYDIAGHKVAEILSGPVPGGEQHASWDGTSDGSPCASGIYFARLVFDGEEQAQQKLVKLR